MKIRKIIAVLLLFTLAVTTLSSCATKKVQPAEDEVMPQIIIINPCPVMGPCPRPAHEIWFMDCPAVQPQKTEEVDTDTQEFTFDDFQMTSSKTYFTATDDGKESKSAITTVQGDICIRILTTTAKDSGVKTTVVSAGKQDQLSPIYITRSDNTDETQTISYKDTRAVVETTTDEEGLTHKIVSIYAEDDTLLAKTDMKISSDGTGASGTSTLSDGTQYNLEQTGNTLTVTKDGVSARMTL